MNTPPLTPTTNVVGGTVAVLGLPYDERSSFARGAAQAPAQIRAALHNGSANLCAEGGLDLATSDAWRDLGDLALPTGDAALAAIEDAAARLLQQQARVFALGGDHSISYPLLRAHARAYPDLTVLHIDAHPDLYDSFDGDRYSHACPWARVMEEGLVRRLVQVGIRTLNGHQRAQAERWGVEVVEMRHWHPGYALALDGPLYLSLDLDALDPAYAPGVSHHEPGGLSTRAVIDIIQRLPMPLIGADLVEYNPSRDVGGVTAMVAAKLFKEIVARLVVAPSL